MPTRPNQIKQQQLTKTVRMHNADQTKPNKTTQQETTTSDNKPE